MATNVNWNGVNYSIPAAGEVGWEALSDFLIALGQTAQTTTFQKFATRVATTTPVTVAAATDCVIISDLTVAGAVAVNLPAGVENQLFVVIDGKGDAHTNNVTISPNGAETIEGAASYVINVARGAAILVFKSGNWSLISAASVRPSAGAVEDDSLTRWNADGSIKDSLGKVDDSGATASTYTTLTFNQTANRAITFPDFDGTLATLAGTETLTNKTMGATNTLTGATAGNFTNTGTVTLPTASTTLVGRDTIDEGANRLQNKHLDANNVEVVDPTDTSKAINFDASGGATATATTIASSQTVNRTITTPDLAGTIALTSGAQVITDKDIDGGTASNTSRITLPSNTTANLGSLTRKAGTVVYDSDTGTFKGDNGTTLSEFSSAAQATAATQGLVTSYAPTVQSRVYSIGNGNHTITDDDGYDIYTITPSTARTVTLPVAANNIGKRLTIINISQTASGTTIATQGADVIYNGYSNSNTSIELQLFMERHVLTAIASGIWVVEEAATERGGITLNNDGGFLTGDFQYQRVGNIICFQLQNATWNSSSQVTSSSTLPVAIRPGTTNGVAHIGGFDIMPGTAGGRYVQITSSGQIKVVTSDSAGSLVNSTSLYATVYGSWLLRW